MSNNYLLPQLDIVSHKKIYDVIMVSNALNNAKKIS